MISGRKLMILVGICQHSYGKTKHSYKLVVLVVMHILIIFKLESVHMTHILTWRISIINHNDNDSLARIQHDLYRFIRFDDWVLKCSDGVVSVVFWRLGIGSVPTVLSVLCFDDWVLEVFRRCYQCCGLTIGYWKCSDGVISVVFWRLSIGSVPTVLSVLCFDDWVLELFRRCYHCCVLTIGYWKCSDGVISAVFWQLGIGSVPTVISVVFWRLGIWSVPTVLSVLCFDDCVL
jgi:hypothetical protein